MRWLLLVACGILPRAAHGYDFKAWDELTHKYVDDQGRVDYAKLKADDADRKKLDGLYQQITREDVAALGAKSAREAFYLDAYNTIVWKNVIDHDTKSVKDHGYEFFQRKFVVAGQELSLDEFEKKIIRPTFKDARVHMALNCASGGCPMLPRYAFTPEKVDEQLSEQAKKFCNEKRNVDFDPATKKLKLSHIFDWYKDDFGKAPEKVIAWINNWRAPDAKLPTDAKIEYVDYDWTLNDQHLLNR